jgi:hypothetical protein
MNAKAVCCQAKPIFKECPMCGYAWCSRNEMLEDPDIELVGYQASFKILTEGLFLFNHQCQGATLAVPAGEFLDLYNGPVFKERLTGTKACPGHCLYHDDFEPCPAKCECAFVRKILQLIRKWPKNGEPSADMDVE